MPEKPREVHHSLPAVERVEYHRKAAKDVLRAARAGHPDAVEPLERRSDTCLVNFGSLTPSAR